MVCSYGIKRNGRITNEMCGIATCVAPVVAKRLNSDENILIYIPKLWPIVFLKRKV
jgi:hypothetical protein